MWINPYEILAEDGMRQVRANFHTHAGQIDACSVNTLEDTRSLYEKLGYGLLVISNHNACTPMQMSNETEQALKFWDGYEHTTPNQHMLCLGVDRTMDVSVPYQDVIDSVSACGGLTILCHPNWIREDYWSDDLLLSLKGYCGIEIFNAVITRLKGSALATKEWDMLLSAHKQAWGFGNDDYHWQSDAGKSWNMILARSNDPEECAAAVRRGAHYVSTGMRLVRLEITGNKLFCEAVRMKEAHMKSYLYRFFGPGGKLLGEEEASAMVCSLPGGGYVRVQVVNEEGCALWTQPVYESGWFA